MSKKQTKKPPPHFYNGPPLTEEEKEEQTEDIYNTGVRETMLDEDDITAAEDGFMRGHEQEPPGKKATRKNAVSHDDQIADELAKQDAEED